MYHKTRWTAKKIRQRLALVESLVYRRRQTLTPFRYSLLADPLDPPPLNADFSQWETIPYHSYWAESNTNFALYTQFQIDWQASLYLPLGDAHSFSHPEALIYLDGKPLAACDRHHQEVRLPSLYCDANLHTLLLHGWSGGGQPLLMHPCELVEIHQPTRDFAILVRVMLDVLDCLTDNDPNHSQLLNALNAAFQHVELRHPLGDAFYASLPPAYQTLQSALTTIHEDSLRGVEVVAAGHAHIDVAWLWTLAQTRRKSGRTFHTVLHLMEQFPDYHFTQSQPQLYDYLRHDYPDLFNSIKAKVAEGRWEPIGGMWVEADCNLSGPESLARQFLLGRRFFAEHFGKHAESPILWLPDVFGYSWALPQLIKKAGMEYFMTIKIGWSQYNRLPYDTFWWQGIDGTRVLTHFSTTPDTSGYASTYNAKATPQDVFGAWQNFQQKDHHHSVLMIFGYGDGGGGPTREMLENIRELNRFPVAPTVRHDKAITFFQHLEAEVDTRLPIWNGELYLEYHRGTYTTQSRNKRANRKSEFLLHDAEFVGTLATLLDSNYAYPADQIRHAWQLVCLNQFHDIIPGSSIGEVYTESLKQYAHIKHIAQTVRNSALDTIGTHISGNLLIINPTSFTRDDLAFWLGQLDPNQHFQNSDNTLVFTQKTEKGTWISVGQLPPFSVTGLHIVSGTESSFETGLSVSQTHLENDFVRLELNPAGDIIRIFDKRYHREVLPTGAIANQFQAFEDRPLSWDAWDIDIFYDDKMWTSEPAHSLRVIEYGPLRATIEIKRRILNSDYTQQISLHYNTPQIYFDTDIDWQERHILLKVAFPVEILSPVATYEIQWGNVQRPTHRNTSWDWARFETVAQKWVDLSEGGYGVSLLNDCKYGHDIHTNIMRISLLRGTTSPDPTADLGFHRFSYALLPHNGSWDSETIPAAYKLNDQLHIHEKNSAQGTLADQSLLSVDQPHVVIETIKPAEDGNGVIVRLYESQRKRGPVTLHTAFQLASASFTNLLEDDEQSLAVHKRTIHFPIKPYQIITLRLVFESPQ